MAAACRIHCAVDLKWGEAETMAMKKTWQLTSITSQAQNGAAEKGGRAGRGETFAYFRHVATSVSINHRGNAGFS